MFFNILNRLPIWKELEENERLIRMFFLGSFMYIIIHAIIYSQYGEENDTIKSVRNYIYYVFLLDFATAGFLLKSNTISENNICSYDSDDNIYNSPVTYVRQMAGNIPKYIRQQKCENNCGNKKSPQSPFIKKNNIAKNNKQKDEATIPIYNPPPKDRNDDKDIELPIYHSNKVN